MFFSHDSNWLVSGIDALPQFAGPQVVQPDPGDASTTNFREPVNAIRFTGQAAWTSVNLL
jgi:hypothetical protein